MILGVARFQQIGPMASASSCSCTLAVVSNELVV